MSRWRESNRPLDPQEPLLTHQLPVRKLLQGPAIHVMMSLGTGTEIPDINTTLTRTKLHEIKKRLKIQWSRVRTLDCKMLPHHPVDWVIEYKGWSSGKYIIRSFDFLLACVNKYRIPRSKDPWSMMLNTDYGCKWVCKNRKWERASRVREGYWKIEMPIEI